VVSSEKGTWADAVVATKKVATRQKHFTDAKRLISPE
jgi:hypothetical protein